MVQHLSLIKKQAKKLDVMIFSSYYSSLYPAVPLQECWDPEHTNLGTA